MTMLVKVKDGISSASSSLFNTRKECSMGVGLPLALYRTFT